MVTKQMQPKFLLTAVTLLFSLSLVFSVLRFIGERNHKTGLSKVHPFHERPATNETLKNTVQRRVKRRDGNEKGRK